MDGLRREHLEHRHQDSALAAAEPLDNLRLIQALEDHRQETERSTGSLETECAMLSDRVAEISRQLNTRLAQASNDGQNANTAPPQGGMPYHEDIPPLAPIVPARLPSQQPTPPAASEFPGSSTTIGQAGRTDGELRTFFEGLRDREHQARQSTFAVPTHERHVPNTTAASAEPIHQELNLRADRPESPRLFGQRSRSPLSSLFGAAILIRPEVQTNARPQPSFFSTRIQGLEELLDAGFDEAEEEEEEEDFSEEESEEEDWPEPSRPVRREMPAGPVQPWAEALQARSRPSG
jgi:hypothetical protein